MAPGDETTGDTQPRRVVFVISSGHVTADAMWIIDGLRSTGAEVVLQAQIPAATRGFFGDWEGMRIREAPPNAKALPSRPWVRSRAEQWRNNRKRQR